MQSSLHSLIPFWPFLFNYSANCQLRSSTDSLPSLLSHPAATKISQLSSSHVKVKVTLRLTVSQSVSESWCRAPSGPHDQIFITVWQLRSCFMWDALSDERMGLSFVYATGSCQRSLSQVLIFDTRDHILLSQNWDFPFRRLLRLAGSRWRYSSPPLHGFILIWLGILVIWPRGAPNRKRRFHCYSQTIPRLLLAYSLPRQLVYQVVA
jgi:hypothetical protein